MNKLKMNNIKQIIYIMLKVMIKHDNIYNIINYNYKNEKWT